MFDPQYTHSLMSCLLISLADVEALKFEIFCHDSHAAT